MTGFRWLLDKSLVLKDNCFTTVDSGQWWHPADCVLTTQRKWSKVRLKILIPLLLFSRNFLWFIIAFYWEGHSCGNIEGNWHTLCVSIWPWEEKLEVRHRHHSTTVGSKKILFACILIAHHTLLKKGQPERKPCKISHESFMRSDVFFPPQWRMICTQVQVKCNYFISSRGPMHIQYAFVYFPHHIDTLPTVATAAVKDSLCLSGKPVCKLVEDALWSREEQHILLRCAWKQNKLSAHKKASWIFTSDDHSGPLLSSHLSSCKKPKSCLQVQRKEVSSVH